MSIRNCIVLGLVAGCVPVASAQLTSITRPSAEYIPAPHGVSLPGDSFNFFDGFEAYTLGPIGGQGGYTVFGANPVGPVVSSANPAAGSQHLRITRGPGANTSFNGAFSADFGNFANKSADVSVDIFHSALNGATAQIVGQAPSQALLSWRVLFSADGDIDILDDADGVPGGSLAFIDSGTNWVPGAYRNLRVELNTGSNSLKYYYNNALIYTGTVGIFAGTAVEQVLLFGDNAYANTTDFIDYDNLSITPAPGTAGLLAAAGLMGLRRRRR